MVIAISLICAESEPVQHRKGLMLSSVGSSSSEKYSMHSQETTMCPHSLGKEENTLENNEEEVKFTVAFKSFGLDWYLEESTFNNLEEYVCMLYDQNEKDINAAKSKMFLQKYLSTSKVIDLAVPPTCRSVLYLHAQRENYVAKIMKSSNLA